MDVVRSLKEVDREDLALAGGKGANLGELVAAGLPVPPGFVVTTDAYRAFAAGVDPASPQVRETLLDAPVPEEIREAVLAAYAALGAGPVAVRSSATAEDLADASFAGQQDTFLNVRGAEALVEAVRACWASLWTERAIDYRARRRIPPDEVSLAVVVQELVEADASGVMFTANPATGRRDQTVINAAWGLGESVVGGTVSPDSLVVDPVAGTVTSRTTAAKQVRTWLRPDGGTVEGPVPDDLRTSEVLDDATAVELARLGARAAAQFGMPQDLEWARADGRLWIVQSRPVTALPPAEAPPPTDWSVPRPRDFYVRGSIVEQLPDPLTPLFAELVETSVTRSVETLISEFADGGVLRDGDLALPCVNGYAYYRYTVRGLLRLSRAARRLAPMILRTSGAGSSVTRWRERSHPAYAVTVERWRDRDVDALSVDDLLAGVGELLDAGTLYYTAVQTIIPLAASSESLLTGFYNRMVRRRGDPTAAILLLGYPSFPIRADQTLYDLAVWSRQHDDLRDWLGAHDATAAVEAYGRGAGSAPDGVGPETWAEWVGRLGAYLDDFGHAVYNLDFANPLPADDPTPLVETLRFYLRGEGVDPYARQQVSAERRDRLADETAARLDPLRRRAFARLLRRAQLAAPIREDALADVGLAWPVLRRLLLELGRRLVAAGAVPNAEDVFWLRRDEIVAGLAEASYAATVEARRQIWRGQRRATPPQILPVGAWTQFLHRWLPAGSETQTGDVITGLAGSAGTVTARARVLGGPADFGRLQPGEILVASITTPAWTPLFALAAGVVTDVGGPLSHSSIVAREYGIPAVLGTGVATRRIADGQQITVDGDAGMVRLVPASGP